MYAVCIIISFLKNKVSESVAPKDDGRDTRVPLVGFRGGGMDVVFACGKGGVINILTCMK